MNPNMNMHGLPQQQIAVSGVAGPNPMMQPGVSPVMMQASPQMQQQLPNPQNPSGQQQPQHPQAEKVDSVSRVKSLLVPMREKLFMLMRTSAFALQLNNLSDNLKRDNIAHPARFDKIMEDFFSYCDQVELHLRTAIQCMQQMSSAQHYIPNSVTTAPRMDPYMTDGPMPYPVYINTVRTHVQSAKDIHDTLISAAQNISQAD